MNHNVEALGLYISFSIIESMGGSITVDSEVNVGTTFTLHIPVAVDANDYDES